MLAVGGVCRRASPGLEGIQHGFDFGRTEHWLPERLDVADKADSLGDVGRHIGFEGTAADEGDDRMQVLGVDAKGGFQGLEVL